MSYTLFGVKDCLNWVHPNTNRVPRKFLSVVKLKLKNPEQLLEMLKSQQKNRSTMVYYLLLQKSQRGMLNAEEQQIIDAELVKRKEAMQSTLDFLSKQQKLKKTVGAPSQSEENSAATHGNQVC